MIVKVDWIDSCTEHGWQRASKNSGGLIRCTSVGYIVRKNKREITLAQSKSSMGNVGELISIPMTCVKEIKTLEG